MQFHRQALTALSLLCLLVMGCSSSERTTPKNETALQPGLAILHPQVGENLEETEAFLNTHFPNVRRLDPTHLSEELDQALRENTIVLIPRIRYLELNHVSTLESFRKEGGALLFWGNFPLGSRAQFFEGTPILERNFYQAMRERSRPLGIRHGVQGWGHRDDKGIVSGQVKKSAADNVPWHCIDIILDETKTYNRMTSPPLDETAIKPEENTLLFYARAGRNTSHLVITCHQDGKELYCVKPVTEAWRLLVVKEEDFHTIDNTPQEADFSLASTFSIGLDNRLVRQTPGSRNLGLSDLHLYADTRPDTLRSEWPEEWLIAPPDVLYGFASVSLRGRFSKGRYRMKGTWAQSLFPPMDTAETMNGMNRRWVPLYTSYNQEQQLQGWPVTAFIESGKQRPVRRWAWIGLALGPDSKPVLPAIIREATEFLRAGWSMHQDEALPATMKQGDPIVLDVRYQPGPDTEPKRIAAELVDFRGQILRRTVTPALDASEPGRVSIRLGSIPAITRSRHDLSIRILLENVGGQNEVFDEIIHPFKILYTFPRQGGDTLLSATGSRIARGRHIQFLLGLNYQPGHALPTDTTPGTWLTPDRFQPELLNRDLDLVSSHGFNMLSIRFEYPSEIPAVRYLMHAAKERGLWISLVMPALDPMQPDLVLAGELLDGIQAEQEEVIASIELGAEGQLGRFNERDVHRTTWTKWLEEQFGSLTHAGEALSPYLEIIKGRAVTPEDAVFASDGTNRVMAAVYRRFVEDTVSRNTGSITRWLRNRRYQQLVGSRRGQVLPGWPGNAEALPIPLAAGAVHLDYISLSGWLFHDLDNDPRRLMFLTALARGLTYGKPVIWRDFGFPLRGEETLPSQENELKRNYELLFKACLQGSASGLFCDRFPRPPIAGEIYHPVFWAPDGRERPLFNMFRGFANQARHAKANPKAWQGQEVEPYSHARGTDGLWQEFASRYPPVPGGKLVEEIRPTGFGKKSTDISPVIPGGTTLPYPCPMTQFNAEWGMVEIQGRSTSRKPGDVLKARTGQELTLELINTGVAAWEPGQYRIPGIISVSALTPEGKPDYIWVEKTRPGKTCSIKWVCPAEGTWTLQPRLGGIGNFGEPLTIEVMRSFRESRP